MVVGITVTCMPSLACFVRHHFPKFSLIDILKSAKVKLLSNRPSLSNATPSASSSHRNIVEAITTEEHNKNLKKSGASYDMHYAELGNLAQITTRVDGDGNIEMDRLAGIRVQHAWEQTSQNNDYRSKV